MSLKTIPGLGKSGTSRIKARRSSIRRLYGAPSTGDRGPGDRQDQDTDRRPQTTDHRPQTTDHDEGLAASG